eukprot:CAMPEP_0171456232 /NCGR_PEP_ID=MMETSP0945-20130129/2801_1 /TAXON_ID=109269 /ORGANISM="Vaucheria litorea, Strain CCMP2940" /LENGTH=77 /DNA_ID=CAMNT_0011981615 /DNA_START=469 /DNA_END=702 /DNA_ORIENTATION=+
MAGLSLENLARSEHPQNSAHSSDVVFMVVRQQNLRNLSAPIFVHCFPQQRQIVVHAFARVDQDALRSRSDQICVRAL